MTLAFSYLIWKTNYPDRKLISFVGWPKVNAANVGNHYIGLTCVSLAGLSNEATKKFTEIKRKLLTANLPNGIFLLVVRIQPTLKSRISPFNMIFIGEQAQKTT